MKTFFKRLGFGEQGQDLIEYTLLMAFVVLASAALFVGTGHSVKGVWSTSNVTLSKAKAATRAERPRTND